MASNATRVAVNFIAFFYKRLVEDPTSLTAACGPATRIIHNSQQGKTEKFSGKEVADFFGKQPKGVFRVVVSSVEPSEPDAKSVEVFVCGSVVNASSGNIEYHFEHMFHLQRNSSDDKSYYITSLTIQHNESNHAVAGAAESKKPDAATKLSWADSTPPMFSKEAPAEPVPAFDVGPSVTHAAPVDPPKAEAPATKAPEPVEAAPAKAPKEKAPKTKPAPTPKEPEPAPAAAPAPAPVVVEAEKKVEPEPAAASPAEPAPAAVSQEKPAPQAPSAPKSLADLVRGKGAAPSLPAAAGEKPKTADKPAAKASPVPAEEPIKAPAEKPAPKPVTPPPAPAPAPTPAVEAAAPAVVAEEAPAAATAVEPKPKSGWGSKTLTFTGGAAGEHKPAVVVAPPETKPSKPAAVSAKSTSAPPAAVATPAAAAATAAPAAGVVDSRASARAQPVPAINYHIFIKGLPEGTTEEEICDMLKPHMQLKRPLKIEQKNVQEPNRDGQMVDKVRTFGFALIDGPEAEIERRRKTVVGKQFKIRGQNVYVDEVREKAAYLPRK